MKISYYLNDGRKKNLYCRISDGTERVTFSLDYSVTPEKWDTKNEELDFEDVHYFTLIEFKNYLTKKYHEFKNEFKNDILTRLKTEASKFTKDNGIDGIAENMFDYFNTENKIPKYKEYVLAFEKFSGQKKGNYKVEIAGTVIHFHTQENIYVMDTDEGLISRLKSFIKNKFYEDIYVITNKDIWSNIYIDAGIEKHIFLPELLNQWEIYWSTKYREIREAIGKTNHLDELKNCSWRQLQVYMECYDGAGDAIDLAYQLDEDILYPISVVAMMNIFDPDTCYEEYCEFEFDGNHGWESIFINDEDDDSPLLYIRPYEF